MMISISLAQMHIAHGAVAANLDRAQTFIAEAATLGSQVILLPELWTSGYDLAQGPKHARANRDVIALLTTEARQRNLHIGGSYILEREGRCYNTFVLVAPDGSQVLYEKIHLFRLMDEHQWLGAGSQPAFTRLSGSPAGIAICYDLRFPELFRQYALSGAGLVLISAEWPLKRSLHWQVLLRARAIENQMFIAAVNAVGETGGENFGGHSAVISPWGEMLVEGSPTTEGLLTAEVDLEQVDRVRNLIPILSDRRPDVYG